MQAPGEVGEVPDRTVAGIDVHPVICEIVVVECRFVKRCQQNRGHAQLLKIIELLADTAEVALSVAVGVKEAAFEDVINDLLREAGGRKEKE
jgi:hypothetical protein